MNTEEKIALRKESNFLLDNIVNLNISLHPELRYIQSLWNLDIIDSYRISRVVPHVVADRFSEEPYDTIVRILPKIVNLINNEFPENAKISDKIKRLNIFTSLEKLGLAKKTDNFKLEICS